MTKKKQTRHISKQLKTKKYIYYSSIQIKLCYKNKKVKTSFGFISSSNIDIILKSFSPYFKIKQCYWLRFSA